MKITKKYIAIFIITVFCFPSSVSALGGLPFGGFDYYVMYCDCSQNFLIYIGPPRGTNFWGLPFIYDPFYTTTYAYYTIMTPGVWSLGLWDSLDYCVITLPYCYISIPGLRMSMVGTSL